MSWSGSYTRYSDWCKNEYCYRIKADIYWTATETYCDYNIAVSGESVQFNSSYTSVDIYVNNEKVAFIDKSGSMTPGNTTWMVSGDKRIYRSKSSQNVSISIHMCQPSDGVAAVFQSGVWLNDNDTLAAITNYTVSYDANGGSNAPSTQTKWYDETLTLSSTKPTRTGYTFNGWSTSKNGDVAYNSGGSYTSNSGATLYAVWGENVLTINHYSNYATESFSNPKNVIGSDKNVIVRTSTFKYATKYTDGLANYTTSSSACYLARTGYDPTGYWGTTTTGGKLVNQDTAFNTGEDLAVALGSTIASSNASVNVYPQWKLKTYTVSYDANGGTDAPEAQTKTHFTDLTLSSVKPKRQRYNFLGWSTAKNGSVIYYPGGTYKAEANVTLYAIWELAASRVTIYGKDGSANSGLCYIYDSDGNQHYAIITVYDESGNAHSVV